MRVLLDNPNPFLLAHGGFQVQIEQTAAGMRAAGLDVDFVRWWDDTQKPDVIHYFGRPSPFYLDAAHARGIKVVLAQLLTGLGSRSRPAIWLERTFIRLGQACLPGILVDRFAWDAFRKADACVANTAWEAHLMSHVFGAPKERVHVVPNGVEDVFRFSTKVERGEWLVCTATITARKRVLELAQAAVQARTPLWVIGKPYSDSDPYAAKFADFVRAHPGALRYQGPVSDRAELAKIYRSARGYVLLSTMETRSLASEEAAACECPLLLSDLPWARSTYGSHACYSPATATPARTAPYLRAFYDRAPQLPPPPRPLSWPDIGRQLAGIYGTL